MPASAPQRRGFDLGDYVEVHERIRLFYEAFPEGRLVTADVVTSSEPDGKPRVWVKALAYRTTDDPVPTPGWSWMELPGSSSYTRGSELENTETSAWGRAIGALGIGLKGRIATADEVRNKEGEADRPQLRSVPRSDGGLVGTAEAGKGQADFELRQTPTGHALAFRLVEGRKGFKVVALDGLAEKLSEHRPAIEGQRVTAWGTFTDESFEKDGKTIAYRVLHLERIETPAGLFVAAKDEPAEEAGDGLGDRPGWS